MHGKTAEVKHDGQTIFRGLPEPLRVGRYHSLVADPVLPECLECSASAQDVVMAVRHRELPTEGATPAITGPEAAAWRRAWALPPRR